MSRTSQRWGLALLLIPLTTMTSAVSNGENAAPAHQPAIGSGAGYESVFRSYRPYKEQPTGKWTQLNRDVTPPQKAAGSTSRAVPESSARDSVPAADAHHGHHGQQ